jgi:hypothetical protein
MDGRAGLGCWVLAGVKWESGLAWLSEKRETWRRRNFVWRAVSNKPIVRLAGSRQEGGRYDARIHGWHKYRRRDTERDRVRRGRPDCGPQGEARNAGGGHQLRAAQQQARRSPPPAQIDRRHPKRRPLNRNSVPKPQHSSTSGGRLRWVVRLPL